MIPVPGYKVTTPYGKRGKHWSCNKNSLGQGVHTGLDIAAPTGTPVVAARGGTVRHTSYGSAFGRYQFAIRCSDGTEDFYAHTLNRPANGAIVKTGQTVAKVGALGNVTGPHLHFEKHKIQGAWNCSNHTDPQPSIDFKEKIVSIKYHYGGKPSGPQTVKTSYVDLERSSWTPLRKGLEHAMIYLNVSGAKFASGKQIGLLRVRAVRTKTNDKTSYHDYPIIAGAAEQLITHPYFEDGDGGTTKYQVKCHSGLAQVTLGTRYRKGAVIY